MSEPRFHPEHADDNLGIPDDAGERAIAKIHRLIRERDEARAARMEAEREIGQLQMRLIGEEARGYRRGVEDAANHKALYGLSQIRAAILALLEQTEPGEKK